jgi:hypothetical protein
MKKFYLLTSLLVAITFLTEAQSFYAIRRDRSLIVSGGTGTSTYFGELKNPGDYLDAKPNVNVGLQYFVKARIAVRADLTWFQLSGDDAEADDSFNGRKGRNLSFLSNNFELAATGAFQLFPMQYRYYQRPVFNVYAFTGIATVFINPTTIMDGK